MTPFAQRSEYSQNTHIAITLKGKRTRDIGQKDWHMRFALKAANDNCYDIWPSGLDLKTICGIEQDWRNVPKPLWKIYWRDYRLAKRTIFSEYQQKPKAERIKAKQKAKQKQLKCLKLTIMLSCQPIKL